MYVLHGSSGTAKYSLDGRKLWQEPYAMFGPPMAAEVFYTMTRKSKDTFTFDFYNAQGTIVNRFNYGDSKTIISGIKQGQDGGLYVFGTIQRKTCDIFLTKYAEHGKQQWSMAYSNDELNGLKYVVAVDVTADFVYLLGRTQLSETGFGCKLIVLKYDHEGRLVSEYFANASRSVRVFKAVEDSVYIAAQGGPEQGEFLVMKMAGRGHAAPAINARHPAVFHHEDASMVPAKQLTAKEEAYRERMRKYMSSLFERFKDKAQRSLDDPAFVIPSEIFESDAYRRWGLGEKGDFSLFEKYYIMQLPILAQTWELYVSIDLAKLSPEEQRFLDEAHTKYGNGRVNYRREVTKEKGTLDQHQEDWFNLIKAVTGSDELDDKGLVFLHRMTPK